LPPVSYPQSDPTLPPATAPVQNTSPPPATSQASDFTLPPPPPTAQGASLPPPNTAPAADTAPPVTYPGLKLGPNDVLLTVRSDNSAVAITGIFENNRAYTTSGLGSSTAQVVLKADEEGTPCNTEEFEVLLANGILWHPTTNFCNTGHILTVPSARPVTPDPPPAAIADFAWQLVSRGNEKQLVYGIPQTDSIAFVASCPRGYNRVVAKFFADAGPKPVAELFGPEELLRYDLSFEPPASEEQGAANMIELFANDAFWNLMRRGLRLPYRIGNGPYAMLDTSSGKTRIEQLLAWCKAR